MRKLILIVLLFLTACAPDLGSKTVPGLTSYGSDVVNIIHDETHSVTCWIYHDGYRGGISCLPDNQITGVSQ